MSTMSLMARHTLNRGCCWRSRSLDVFSPVTSRSEPCSKNHLYSKRFARLADNLVVTKNFSVTVEKLPHARSWVLHVLLQHGSHFGTSRRWSGAQCGDQFSCGEASFNLYRESGGCVALLRPLSGSLFVGYECLLLFLYDGRRQLDVVLRNADRGPIEMRQAPTPTLTSTLSVSDAPSTQNRCPHTINSHFQESTAEQRRRAATGTVVSAVWSGQLFQGMVFTFGTEPPTFWTGRRTGIGSSESQFRVRASQHTHFTPVPAPAN